MTAAADVERVDQAAAPRPKGRIVLSDRERRFAALHSRRTPVELDRLLEERLAELAAMRADGDLTQAHTDLPGRAGASTTREDQQ